MQYLVCQTNKLGQVLVSLQCPSSSCSGVALRDLEPPILPSLCLFVKRNCTSIWDHSELAKKYWKEPSCLMSIKCYNWKKTNQKSSVVFFLCFFPGGSILPASISFSLLWQHVSPSGQPMEGDGWTDCLLNQRGYLLHNKSCSTNPKASLVLFLWMSLHLHSLYFIFQSVAKMMQNKIKGWALFHWVSL